jgi:Holliday junction resolvase-like predicted endonuclease
MIRAARHFLRYRGEGGECRFDVMSVDLSQAPAVVEHWSDAFTLDTNR